MTWYGYLMLICGGLFAICVIFGLGAWLLNYIDKRAERKSDG